MTRFLCSTLLFLVAIPLCAQEGSLERQFPRSNQAVLLQTKQQLTRDLQQVQQMLGLIPPSETQITEMLKGQQEDLTKQIKDVTQQLQAFEVPAGEVPKDAAAPPQGMPGIQGMPGMMPPPLPRPQDMMPNMQSMPPGMPMPNMSGGMGMPMQTPSRPPLSDVIPMQAPPQYNPPYPMDGMGGMMMPGTPNWGDMSQAWDTSPWGARPASSSRDVLEMKQSIDSLRKEIADLKDTVKTLETQIQLLNRNIVLSERARTNSVDVNATREPQ